jgi:hypothetical protein
MPRKKVELPEEETKTRQVKVRTVTNEEYVREEPAIDVEVETEQEEWADPFASFSEIVTDNQQATIHIWRLPNFETDGGRTSPNGTVREYCGSVIYRENDDTLLHEIQQRVPLGGVVSLELKQGGNYQKSGLLRLAKPPGVATSNGQHSQAFPPITINQPAAQQAPMADPMLAIERQAETFLKVAEVIKKLQPEPQAQVVNSNGDVEPPTMRDRLLEGVILKMVESPKPDSLERVADLLAGGRQETSWTDTIIAALAPAVPEILRTIGPGLNALMLRFASGGQQTSPQPVTATSSGVQEPPPAQPQLTGEQPASPAPPPMSPVERAYVKTLMRLLEDCMEHAEVSAVSADRISVTPAAESIVELVDRFPEQLNSTVAALLEAPPLSVFDMCASVITPHAAQILALKEKPGAVEWIEELQTETKRILSETNEDTAETKEA